MKYKRWWIIICVPILLLLIFVIAILISFDYDIQGWGEYNKEIKSKYSFVKNIDINNSTPVQIEIVYRMNKTPDDREVDDIFNDTIKFLSSDQRFADLVKYHLKKYDYPFGTINIRLVSKQKNKECVIQIRGADRGEGETKYNHYTKWYICYNNGNSQEYKTVSFN